MIAPEIPATAGTGAIRPAAAPHAFVGEIPEPGQRQTCRHCGGERSSRNHQIPTQRTRSEK